MTTTTHMGGALQFHPHQQQPTEFARGHAVGSQVYALLYRRRPATPAQIEQTVNAAWADTEHSTRWAAGYLTGWMQAYHQQQYQQQEGHASLLLLPHVEQDNARRSIHEL